MPDPIPNRLNHEGYVVACGIMNEMETREMPAGGAASPLPSRPHLAELQQVIDEILGRTAALDPERDDLKAVLRFVIHLRTRA